MTLTPLKILLLAFIIVLLFGGRRLAELGKGLADGIRSFKKGIADASDDDSAHTLGPARQTLNPERDRPQT